MFSSSNKQNKADILAFAEKNEWQKIKKLENNQAFNLAVEHKLKWALEPLLEGNYDLVLRRATYYKNIFILPSILSNIKNVNGISKSQKGRSALHFAAQNNLISTAQMLIDKGAFVDLFDAEGNTPWKLAHDAGHYECAQLLANRGARLMKWYSMSNTDFERLTESKEPHCQKADENTLIKSSKPSLKGTRSEWVLDFFTSPSPTKASLIDTSQLLLTSEEKDIERDNQYIYLSTCYRFNSEDFIALSQIFKETLTQRKIRYCTNSDLVELNKNYQDGLEPFITKMLTDPELLSCILINASGKQIDQIFKAAKDCRLLEKLFQIEFEIIFKDAALTPDKSNIAYFYRSKGTPDPKILENKKAYWLETQEHLLLVRPEEVAKISQEFFQEKPKDSLSAQPKKK